jgi:hypothetical protein
MSYGTTPPPPGTGPTYPGYGAPPPEHPRATTILVLGILSLVTCGILGIPAWIMGNTALREIDASRGALGGRGSVQAGRVCGIIATVILALTVLLLIAVIALAFVGTTTSTSFSETTTVTG